MSHGSLHITINMYPQDTTTATILRYFTDATPLVEEKIVRNQILTERENQGSQG